VGTNRAASPSSGKTDIPVCLRRSCLSSGRTDIPVVLWIPSSGGTDIPVCVGASAANPRQEQTRMSVPPKDNKPQDPRRQTRMSVLPQNRRAGAARYPRRKSPPGRFPGMDMTTPFPRSVGSALADDIAAVRQGGPYKNHQAETGNPDGRRRTRQGLATPPANPNHRFSPPLFSLQPSSFSLPFAPSPVGRAPGTPGGAPPSFQGVPGMEERVPAMRAPARPRRDGCPSLAAPGGPMRVRRVSVVPTPLAPG
jgi:hypothetical protein